MPQTACKGETASSIGSRQSLQSSYAAVLQEKPIEFFEGRSEGSDAGCSTDSTVCSRTQCRQEDITTEQFLHQTVRTNRIACLGAGYVGGPTMATIALMCPELTVHVVDTSQERIDAWNSDTLPIYEPGLDEVVMKCRGRNLFFSTNVGEAVALCDIIFISVNTPTKNYGSSAGKAVDLTAWEAASRTIAKHASRTKIVVEKSTVPLRTAESLMRILEANSKVCDIQFIVVSNPEFMSEGTAMENLRNPDRVLLGGNQATAAGRFGLNVLTNIYKRWVPEENILKSSVWSAELSKLAANAFLAQRVSSINTIAMLCEKAGADISEVARAIGADSRIGPQYLHASVGFGGSCLQKDLLSLCYLCSFYGLREAAQYWEMVKKINDIQKHRFVQRVMANLFETVCGKKITVFGFAFKKNTADVRGTPAIDICAGLMAEGARLHVYDPRVKEETARASLTAAASDTFDPDTQFVMEASPEKAVQDSHAIIVLTEWDIFKTYDYSFFFSLMKKPAFIFDGRNILNHSKLASIGFEVHGVGVSSC